MTNEEALSHECGLNLGVLLLHFYTQRHKWMPKTFKHVILSAAKNLSSIRPNRENQREIPRCAQNDMRTDF